MGTRGTAVNVLLTRARRVSSAKSRGTLYRQHMHECLQLAGMMTSPEHRAVLVAMAQAWKLLAQFHCLAEPQEYRHNQTLLPHNQVASM
jgi:hypothetical protein